MAYISRRVDLRQFPNWDAGRIMLLQREFLLPEVRAHSQNYWNLGSDHCVYWSLATVGRSRILPPYRLPVCRDQRWFFHLLDVHYRRVCGHRPVLSPSQIHTSKRKDGPVIQSDFRGSGFGRSNPEKPSRGSLQSKSLPKLLHKKQLQNLINLLKYKITIYFSDLNH